MSEVLLRVEGLVKHFPVTAGVLGKQVATVRAVDGVSFEIERGKTLGLVGESGCGKSTVGRTLLRLETPTAGRVLYKGRDLATLSEAELRPLRRELQIVFQDPFGSLNPRMTVADIVGEALEVHDLARGEELERRVIQTLDRVGIPASWRGRYPHEFSGGQRQRISIARAIAPGPSLVVCDEAVSALDVSIQAQVLNLLLELQKEMGFAYLFISHDLSVVQHVSDEVAVMYLGQIVERAPVRALFENPVHPYTQALLSAIPVPDPRRAKQRIVLEGDVPTPLAPPPGCRFHTRCPVAEVGCAEDVPRVVSLASAGATAHTAQCVHAEGATDDAAAHARILGLGEESLAARPPAPAVAPAYGKWRVREKNAPIPEPLESVTSRSRELLGVAGVLGVFATAAFGHVLSAMILGLAAVALVPRALHVAAVIGLAAAGFLIASSSDDRLAAKQLAGLASEIDAFSDLVGHPPASLAEVAWRAVGVLGNDSLTDPWGRRWVYETPGGDGRSFDLGSYGPDGELGGGDDLGDFATD